MATDLGGLRGQVEILRWAARRKAELKELEDSARAAVEVALGEDDEGLLDGELVVAWRRHKRRALDQKFLRTKFPDIWEECRTTSEVRRFEVCDVDD